MSEVARLPKSSPNPSGIVPLGYSVLVEPYKPEKLSSIIEIPDNLKERVSMVEMRVTVIAIGPEAWREEREPRAKVGDKVMIAKFAGHMAVGIKDDKQYRVVNDRDIFVRLEE